MPNTLPQSPALNSRTRIVFDLRDVLTESEINRFEQAAEAAHAGSLTEHFINITLKTPAGLPAAPADPSLNVSPTEEGQP